MTLWNRTARGVITLAVVAAVLAATAGCNETATRTAPTARHPVTTLVAADSVGRAVFTGDHAETILAARRADDGPALPEADTPTAYASVD